MFETCRRHIATASALAARTVNPSHYLFCSFITYERKLTVVDPAHTFRNNDDNNEYSFMQNHLRPKRKEEEEKLQQQIKNVCHLYCLKQAPLKT